MGGTITTMDFSMHNEKRHNANRIDTFQTPSRDSLVEAKRKELGTLDFDWFHWLRDEILEGLRSETDMLGQGLAACFQALQETKESVATVKCQAELLHSGSCEAI